MTQKTRKSLNLEIVSNAKADSPEVEDVEQIERRRRPRLMVAAEQFRLLPMGKIFSIYDLSSSGMAIRVLNCEDLILFPVAMKIEGLLNLKGVRHPVKAVVRRVAREMVGCEFYELSSATRQAIESFLNPETLGRELRPLPSTEKGALWYHGPSGTDLLFWRGIDGDYQRFAFYVLGSFIQWDREEGLGTGRVQGSEQRAEDHGVVRFETMMIEKDARPDARKLEVAKALVMSSNLPEDMKRWCQRHLNEV